jgi:hypothetical protein
MAEQRLEAIEIARTVREMGLPRSSQMTTLLGFAAEQERKCKRATRLLRTARLQGFVFATLLFAAGALGVFFLR